MPISQNYFELRDVRPFQGQSWTTLRQATDDLIDSTEPSITRIEEFIGIATAAVYAEKQAAAETLDWSTLDVGSHRSGVEHWGYRAADIFRGWDEVALGINLVIDQHLEEDGRNIWHLHPDLSVALRLFQQGDSWYRPEEGWVEVARMKRDTRNQPTLLEIRTEFLADYLTAREMALYCSSYRERTAVTFSNPSYSWSDVDLNEASGRDRREARTTRASYPDPENHFWTMGCLWRTEWVTPVGISVRVRGDEDPHKTSFVVDTDGARKEADQLAGAIGWLYFEPTLVSTLLRYRGARLSWFTEDTGSLGATNSGVHFGVNDLGFITVYAKDIGYLPAWEQRLWSAHNVTPDGGVSRELFASQMEVNPADTVAPESELSSVLDKIDVAFAAKYGTPIMRGHENVPALLRRAHRFQVAETDGLLELSKEVTRLFIERVDVDAIVATLGLPKGEPKLGSLKALEKLVTHLRPEADARTMMAPLFGIYDLRLADAHLGSSKVDSGKSRAGVDGTTPAAMQGRQLLRSFVNTLQQITAVLL